MLINCGANWLYGEPANLEKKLNVLPFADQDGYCPLLAWLIGRSVSCSRCHVCIEESRTHVVLPISSMDPSLKDLEEQVDFGTGCLLLSKRINLCHDLTELRRTP